LDKFGDDPVTLWVYGKYNTLNPYKKKFKDMITYYNMLRKK